MALQGVTIAVLVVIVHAQLIPDPNNQRNKNQMAYKPEFNLTQLNGTQIRVYKASVDWNGSVDPDLAQKHKDEEDIVDREDPVLQFLPEMVVNTDSEITSIQGDEFEESR